MYMLNLHFMLPPHLSIGQYSGIETFKAPAHVSKTHDITTHACKYIVHVQENKKNRAYTLNGHVPVRGCEYAILVHII